MTKQPTKENPKKINLALQGGGAHGAFTWGVLDQLCEDGRLVVDGLAATSAGAMNASVYSYGKMTGGLEGARKSLYNFWKDISNVGKTYSPVKPMVWEQFMAGWSGVDTSLSFQMFEGFTQTFSPYEFNPLNFNPLEEVLRRHVDFDKLKQCQCTQMFICATNVRTNKMKVFKNQEISCKSVLASACLPMLFQAVEIDGEAYWDGGYMGNPALYPLVHHTPTDDIVIIHINPVHRAEVPKTSREILDRVNEISFNSSLLREMRSILLVNNIIEEGGLKPEFRDQFPYAKLKLHSIRADDVTKDFSLASKFSPDWEFLCHLRDQGREVTKQWIDKNIDKIGVESTVDLKAEFT